MNSDITLPRFPIMGAAIALAAFLLFAGSQTYAQPSSSKQEKEFQFKNQLVTIHYSRGTGAMDIEWRDGHKLFGITSGAALEDGRMVSSATYKTHELSETHEHSSGTGFHVYTVRSTASGMPELLQHIWIYDNRPWIAIEAELDAKEGTIGSRHFDAVMSKGQGIVQLGDNKHVRALHVPFDNDMWFRYDGAAISDLKPDQSFTSNDVTALYDNVTRAAIILGSITHDTWKTAIEAHARGGQLLDLDIFGGIASPTGVRTDTHDTVPHGAVAGAHIVSPRIFIGSFTDWRDGLEAYGAANAMIHPPLTWSGGAPTGWNSWAAYADKIDDKRYLGSAAFVRDVLVPQGFGANRVVYVNLDAFWSKLDAVQLSDAVSIIKKMSSVNGTRFEPGIYWTPFAYWSDDLDAYVEGTNMKYRYRDILLKAPNGSILPKVDGGLAIDPSHPGAKARATYYLQEFQKLGFQYLKLDFLSHGALEGAHFDPTIQTGIQAYNLGMQQIVNETHNRIFLSLSIAPLFPSGYGHSRRLSCDTKGHISGGDQSTEYMLNSLTYGWWTSKNLYIVDPDHVVLGSKADQGARNAAEGKSRLLSAVISGGMILDSSRLADDPEGQSLAKEVYSSSSLFAVAAEGKTFRPIEGDTGNKATPVFIRFTEHGAYLALFNYDDKQPQKIAVPFDRIDRSLSTASSVSITDVASGATLTPSGTSVDIELSSAASMLIELRWK